MSDKKEPDRYMTKHKRQRLLNEALDHLARAEATTETEIETGEIGKAQAKALIVIAHALHEVNRFR